MKTKPLIVLCIEQTKRTPKRFRWMPQTLFPTVQIDRRHGWLVITGFTTIPDRSCAFPPNYLKDAIDEWRKEYGPSWKIYFRGWNGAKRR